jgi:hypothetical protein
VSRSFPGDDPDENDGDSSWCDAADEFELSRFGTPGDANPECPGPGECRDGDSIRALDPPAADDLIITETMGDPSKVNDTEGEYLEVWVRNDADLSGLTLTYNGSAREYRTSACLPAAGGSFIVFARNPSSGANGGISGVDFRTTVPTVTNNAGPHTFTVTAGQAEDSVTFNTTPTSGKSRNLSARRFDTTANDSASSWCPTVVETYGLGDFGTPATTTRTVRSRRTCASTTTRVRSASSTRQA